MNEHADQNNHPFLDAEDADDIINGPLMLAADDPTGLHEAQTNTWGIGLSAEQARRTSPALVCAFVRAVLAQREGQLLAQRGHTYPMLFYCWVNAQAGQLRLSLVRELPAGLPFSGRFRIIERLETIAEQFLDCPYLDGIPWEALEIGAWDAADREPALPILDVWAQRIPGSGDQPAALWSN